MRVKVKSLGPIRDEADIELDNLTVFFGPQNTGKSTVMRAIYYSLSPPITGPTYEKGAVALGPLTLLYNSPGKEVEFRVSINRDYVKPRSMRANHILRVPTNCWYQKKQAPAELIP